MFHIKKTIAPVNIAGTQFENELKVDFEVVALNLS